MALQIGQTTLQAIRNTAIDRADEFTAGGAPASYIPIPRWNQYIDASRAELYDIVIQKYDGNYKVAPYFPFVADGVNSLYPLPSDFYKLVGVDVQLNGAAPLTSSNGWFTLHRFNNEDRNRFSYPGVAVFGWWTSLFYNLQGDNLWFIPIPQGGQMFRILYVPRPVALDDIGTITMFGVVQDNTVVINGITFTANTNNVIDASPNFIIGASDVPTAQNLAAVISSPYWTANTDYTLGQTVYNIAGLDVFAYVCVVAGMSSSSGGPNVIAAGTITDGMAGWTFAGIALAPWQTGITYTIGDYATNSGNVYQSATTGVASVAPTGTGSAIAGGGTLTWNYLSPALTQIFVPSFDGVNPVTTVTLSPVASVNGATIEWSSSASMALDPQPKWSNIVDDQSRWVEYIAVDAAIKALRKQQLSTEELNMDKALLLKRIEEVAAHRDPSEPATVSDVRRSNLSYPYAFGGRQ